MDAAPLGQLTAEIMETIEDAYGTEGKLIDALIIVETEHVDDDGDVAEVCRIRSIGKRYTSDLGMVERARVMLHSVPDAKPDCD
jgi:hypothetical protein